MVYTAQTSPFKIGDKVKVVHNKAGFSSNFIGKKGTIYDLDGLTGRLPYCGVQIHQGPVIQAYFTDLVLVTPKRVPIATFAEFMKDKLSANVALDNVQTGG